MKGTKTTRSMRSTRRTKGGGKRPKGTLKRIKVVKEETEDEEIRRMEVMRRTKGKEGQGRWRGQGWQGG